MIKKLLAISSIILILSSSAMAGEVDVSFETKKCFFKKPCLSVTKSPCEEVKKVLNMHARYANTYDYEGLQSLYAQNYLNSDGFNKDIYFDLVKKTWQSYPDIRYTMDVKSVDINSNTAVAQVVESAIATTGSKSGVVDEKGILESKSTSSYYFEKIGDKWLITSDHVSSELTSLKYGSAKYTDVEISAPQQIGADVQYTSTLKIVPPRESLIIASIGRENITYPQKSAEEVFRKLPVSGILERVFTSNTKNINEYAVASYGITKAEIKNGTEIKIYVTGLGFVMSRVNVIPKNEFVKVAENGKQE